MGLGILNDRHFEKIPGTVYLEDINAGAEDVDVSNLKRAPGRPDIILVPQPSDDPNDPLNWPIWQKSLVTGVICLTATLSTAVLGPILTPSSQQLIDELGFTYEDIAHLTGYQLLGIAPFAPLTACVARLYGKRPVFVVSAWIALIGAIVCSCANDYQMLLAGRVINGIGGSAFEVLVSPMIGEIFFVHERGRILGFYSLSLWGGSMFGLIPDGVISQNLGWRYTFIISTVFMGFFAIMVTLFCPETVYHRSRLLEIDRADVDVQHTIGSKPGGAHVETTTTTTNKETTPTPVTPSVPPRESWFKQLSMYHGRLSKANPLVLFFRPIALLANVAIVFCMLLQGMNQVFSVGISFLTAQIFSVPPYNLSAAQLGYLGVGAVVGVLLGTAFAAAMDPIIEWFSRKNRGVYEPEFRLLLTIPTLIATGIGYYGFGLGIAAGHGYIVASMFWGFAIFGVVSAITTGGTYIVDGYRDISEEAFVVGIAFKNFMFYGFSLFLNAWLTNSGPRNMFLVIGSVAVGVCVLAVPMWIFGKKIRSFYHRYDIWRALHLELKEE